MSTANEYYLQYQTENDLELVKKRFSSWDEMLKSAAYRKLERQAENGQISGYGWLIVRPGKLPMVGGFVDGMRDPSR